MPSLHRQLAGDEGRARADAVVEQLQQVVALGRAHGRDREAVMHEQLQAAGPRIGEQVAVVRASLSERIDDHRQQRVGTRAHVLWLRAQPQRIDADHSFSAVAASSCSQAAQDSARVDGQRTDSCVPPRVSSMWISEGLAADAESTYRPAAADGAALQRRTARRPFRSLAGALRQALPGAAHVPRRRRCAPRRWTCRALVWAGG